MASETPPNRRAHKWLPVLPLAALASWGTWVLARAFPPALSLTSNFDLYFDSDIPRTFHWASHLPGALLPEIRHPFAPWGVYGAVRLADFAVGPDLWDSLQLLLTINAFLWTVLFYGLARLLTGAALPAACLTVLALTCASTIFWLPAPDVFAPGSTTLLAALFLTRVGTGKLQAVRIFCGQFLTFSTTVTNVSLGVAASFLALQWRRALALNVVFFLGIGVLVFFGASRNASGIRQLPSLRREVVDEFRKYRNWRPPLKKVVDLVLVPLSPPGLTYQYYEPGPGLENGYRVLSTMRWGAGFIRDIDPPSRSLQLLGYALWLGLLTSGLRFTWVDSEHRPLNRTLLLGIAAQFAIHLFFGVQTFLFSLHWLPLLVLLVAAPLRSDRRNWFLAAVLLLAVLNLRNNIPMFFDGMQQIRGVLDGRPGELVPSPE